jgi:nucleotide-binding universal stress UspA family protein
MTAHFSVGAETGSPAPVIARIARERGAELILSGIEAHGAPGRAQTEDAALQVTRTSDVPVVAVPPDVALLPRRALVAMDFSEASVRAARAALLMLTGGGVLTLAHVAPDVDFREMGKEGWGQIYDQGVAGLLEQLAGELRVPGDVDVDTVVARGDTSARLLELAARGAFELVAAGSQTAPWVEWHLTGSVSTSLLRGARCTVLIAPPADPRG